MIVTFLGGPLHGTHGRRDDAPNRIAVASENGTQFTYELRQQTGDGVGNGPIVWSHTTYAPVGIPISEFFDLSQGVFPPMHMIDD